MAIVTNDDKCIGCGECVLACPCDVLRVDTDTQKCVVKYPYDCQLCNLCVYNCPEEALTINSEKAGRLVLGWS